MRVKLIVRAYLLYPIEMTFHALYGYFLASLDGLSLEHLRECPLAQMPQNSVL